MTQVKEKGVYNILEPLYKQIGLEASVALPYQQFIDGLLIGRTLNLIMPKDFERHVHKTIIKLMKLKEHQRFDPVAYKIKA
jgi:hypothetical protein